MSPLIADVAAPPTTASMASLPLFSIGEAPTLPPVPLAGVDLSSTTATSGAKANKPAPLLISSALPPIPSKALEKISNRVYIDFKELLPDNVSLLQNLQEMGGTSCSTHSAHSSKLREVPDPLSWVSCFLTFMAAKVDSKECRDLAAYAQIIINLSRKHGGKGWMTYDRLFRGRLGGVLGGAEPFPDGRNRAGS